MLNNIISYFRSPTARQLAQDELEESRRQFLKHQSASEYHSKLAQYYSENAKRLVKYTTETV